MSDDDKFDKLFAYMQEFRTEVATRFDETDERIDQLMSTMDGFARSADTNEIENAARDQRFDRLLDWARKVSAKTGIPLKDL